jgi:replication fork protection complex subunit Csm3/Swi3
MSTSLDDIWDEPAAVSPPRPRSEAGSDDEDAVAARPSKRRRATQQPLFLDSDSDREQGPSTRLARASSAAPDAPDIDHLFEGLDDDDDGTALQTLDVGPDLATLQRRAEAAARASSPLTPHAVLPSSSPPRDGGEDRWKDGGKGKGDGKEKKRKPLPKLDEARLLGEDGFPALLKQTKGFVPKGKGHEVCETSIRVMMKFL